MMPNNGFSPEKLSSSIKEDFSREDSISVVHVFLASLVASTTSFQACLEIIWTSFSFFY